MINLDFIKDQLSFLDVVYLEEVDSTNTYAKRNIFNKDTLIITTNQTAGRGRFSRSFFSHKDSGLYFTLSLKNLEVDTSLYTLIMGVAVSDVLLNSKIKWLNDIFINNLKVCGILAEGVIFGSKQANLVIGVGINLNVKNIPKELENVIISYDQIDENFDINEIVINIINNFYNYLNVDREVIISKYKEKCLTLNQEIIVEDKFYYAYDIDINGHLIAKDKAGNIFTFNAKEVSINAKK